MRSGIWTAIVVVLLVSMTGLPEASGQNNRAKLEAAMPDKPRVTPKRPRQLLIFELCRGYKHESIPLATQALTILGSTTGAYEAVHSSDISLFEPDSLAEFDAVCMNNTTGELFAAPDLDKLSPAEREAALERQERLQKSLLDFVAGGKGIIGIHAATDCCYNWPEYGVMMGGYFDGHPWNEEVTIKLDEPDHPLNAMFAGEPLVVKDEIYQFKFPYSRERLRVLLSIDTAHTDMTKEGIRRRDDDFAVSWIRGYGKGRVFYCSLGHRDAIFWNPRVLEHYLAGIQYAMGDLTASDTPSIPSTKDGWEPLFNGENLDGWQGLVGNPKTRAAMSPDELAKAQTEADEKMRAHWKVEDEALVFDGQGENICTVKEYGDFGLKLQWKIEPGGDSGIYLRGSPQVQIWDAEQHSEGSGGLYNNQHNPSKPFICADRPAGKWNNFEITMIGDRVTVWLNNMLVADNVVMENYWEPGQPIYPMGPIELQSHNTPLSFRKIMIREIPPQEAAAARQKVTWHELFNGKDLSGWTCKPDSWAVEDGTLSRKNGGDYIWTEEQFGDFAMELEFKLAEGTNSGIFLRTADVKDPVQTGIEVQILDSHGKEQPDKHDCGAVYDCVAPTKNTVLPPGEWNHMVIVCEGEQIGVVMNGVLTTVIHLDQWTEPHKNPDGTENKFNTAYKRMPRVGYIGFQDHGKPVWYRNIRIRKLSE